MVVSALGERENGTMSEMIDKQNVIDLVSLAIEDDWDVDYTIDRINEMPVVNKDVRRKTVDIKDNK